MKKERKEKYQKKGKSQWLDARKIMKKARKSAANKSEQPQTVETTKDTEKEGTESEKDTILAASEEKKPVEESTKQIDPQDTQNPQVMSTTTDRRPLDAVKAGQNQQTDTAVIAIESHQEKKEKVKDHLTTVPETVVHILHNPGDTNRIHVTITPNESAFPFTQTTERRHHLK